MLYAVWPEATAILEAGRLDPAALLAITQAIAGRLLIAAHRGRRPDRGARLPLAALELHAAHAHVAPGHAGRDASSRKAIRRSRRGCAQIRLERSRKRMLANVPKATVVITNPTHYSVALRYLPETDAAPMCMAKGVDDLALRIREKAKEHNVPHRRERGAGARAVRDGRGRTDDPARAFRGGGESHRLRHEHGEGEAAMMRVCPLHPQEAGRRCGPSAAAATATRYGARLPAGTRSAHQTLDERPRNPHRSSGRLTARLRHAANPPNHS